MMSSNPANISNTNWYFLNLKYKSGTFPRPEENLSSGHLTTARGDPRLGYFLVTMDSLR